LEEICMSTKQFTRDYISPSDLTFTYGECKRCFWLKYNKGISTPGFMPLVGPMSSMQEGLYRDMPSSALDPQLPAGTISRYGENVESQPIILNGVETRWRIKGKFDVVVEYDNGTVGLIDCKVTTSTMDDGKVAHYLPQLEAYCFALENPLRGNPVTVSHSGLMMWQIADAKLDQGSYAFKTNSAFLMVPRGPEGFQRFIEEVVAVLDGHIPDSDSRCKYCAYVNNRQE
jgi:PD-(D/E)XK nuclease superfamily